MLDGSTATVCVITNIYVITANIGDSPALIFSQTELIAHTNDHDCTNEQELERVKPNCVKFKNDPNARLPSGLMVTRSFGDLQSIRYGLIADPEINIWIVFRGLIYVFVLIVSLKESVRKW